MADLELTYSMNPYDRVLPLITGEVKPTGIALKYTRLPSPDIFYRQTKFNQFDVSEMSSSAYLIARARGWPYRMLPVFHNRAFFYTTILVRQAAGIRKPEDLKGKRFGMAEYAQSAALWTRGILQHEFGVHPEDMEWFQERTAEFSHSAPAGFKPPSGVTLHYAKTDLGTMMQNGELDAGLIQSGASMDRPKGDVWRNRAVRRLFLNHRKEGIRYYKKTGVFPPQHITVVRESILENHPWVATSLFQAFEEAKRHCMKGLYKSIGGTLPSMLVFGRTDLQEQRMVFGDDPFPYGVKANAKAIDMIQTFSLEQGLTSRKQPWEELFPEEILLAEGMLGK